MIERYRDGAVPDAPGRRGDRGDRATAVAAGFATRLDTLDFTGALDEAWELVRALNRFVEERAPWKLAKSEDAADAARLDETLRTLADGSRVLGIVLHSVMPGDLRAAARRRRRRPATTSPGSRRRAAAAGRSARRQLGRAALPAHRVAARRGVIDTHAHLQGLPEGPDAAIEAAADAGVDQIVCVGDSPELRARRSRSATAIRACARPPGCTRTAPSSGTTSCATSSPS